MRRIISVGLLAGLLVPFPGNPVSQAPEQLPMVREMRFDPPAAGPRQAQTARRQMSGETGLILLMAVALKGMHGN